MKRCAKIPYRGEAAAHVALGRLRCIGARRAYRCPCGAWHLTSQPWRGRFRRYAT